MDFALASATGAGASRDSVLFETRPSTQQYSPESQFKIIRQWAATHNMEIVQDYSDHRYSGLNIAGREVLFRGTSVGFTDAMMACVS